MQTLSRRRFLAGGAMGTAAALSLAADPLGMPIGTQLYPVRDLVSKDFPATLKQIAGMGYRTVELCSPVGYADSGFAGIDASHTGRFLRALL